MRQEILGETSNAAGNTSEYHNIKNKDLESIAGGLKLLVRYR